VPALVAAASWCQGLAGIPAHFSQTHREWLTRVWRLILTMIAHYDTTSKIQMPKYQNPRNPERGRQLSHHKTKLNQIWQKQACILK